MINDLLRKQISTEEFDYQVLLDSLRGYSRPRDKISDLLRKGVIIRVKKGLYVFGNEYRRRPYSRELLANLVYGPSYISLEYALQYHGLIPERVEAVTSVTPGRSRSFSTPVGLFTYRMISLEAFQIGMGRADPGDELAFLIAVPEKALADLLVTDRGSRIRSQKDVRSYLLDSLRIDPQALLRLRPGLVREIANRYKLKKIRLLADFLARLKNSNRRKRHA